MNKTDKETKIQTARADMCLWCGAISVVILCCLICIFAILNFCFGISISYEFVSVLGIISISVFLLVILSVILSFIIPVKVNK